MYTRDLLGENAINNKQTAHNNQNQKIGAAQADLMKKNP